MSSVVLDNSSTTGTPNSSTLTANGARIGRGGIGTTGPVIGGESGIIGGRFFTAVRVEDARPAPPATTKAFNSTTYASDVSGGGLNPNQLQKFVEADPLVSGPSTSQQYEQGYFVPMATTFAPPAVAVDSLFVNRRGQTAALDYIAMNGILNTTGAPVVVPLAGITAGSVVELRLLGGTAAAFTAAAATGLVEPTITVQVGATTAASTFTASAAPVGWTYAWKVLRA
jgi:hypothetical protein